MNKTHYWFKFRAINEERFHRIRFELYSLFLSGKEILGLFSLAVSLLSLDGELGSLLIELHELGEIELGLLEELNLSDEHVLEGEDLLAFLLNLCANSVSSAKDIINIYWEKNLQFLHQLLEGRLLALIDHDLHHLLTDQLLLRGLGIASCSHLSASSLGEGNSENSEEISITGLGLNEGFNKSVPFLNEGAELIPGDVHSVEVGEAVVSLDFFNLDLHFSPSLIVALSIQISQRYFEHTTSQAISSNLYKRKFNRSGTGPYFVRLSCCRG